MTSMNNLLKVHHQFNQPVPLDFGSVDEVPESYLLPEPVVLDDHEDGNNIRSSSIPVIDLMDPNAAELIGKACESWGVFQVTNHGLPSSLFEGAESQVRRLFTLPAEEKRKILSRTAHGYGTAKPWQFEKSTWHERYTSANGSNFVDDSKVLWPEDHQHFCDQMEEYRKEMKPLAYKLFLLMLEYLGVKTQERIDWAASTCKTGEDVLQFNSYPCCPNPSRAIGIPPHTDTLILAILHQGGINGLQVYREGTGWILVPVIENALVVNVGDLLHIFSNGKFHNVSHRAVVNKSKHRISLAYFVGYPFDSIVVPFPEFQNPCYRSTTLKEYAAIKAMSKDSTEAISSFKI